MSTEDKEIEFVPSGRGKARCPADPSYPNGKEIPPPPNARATCKVELPYPAPECGYFRVGCKICRNMVLITAAGRADDPVSVQMPCNLEGGQRAN